MKAAEIIVRPLACWWCGKNGLTLTEYRRALVCGPCFVILRLDEVAATGPRR